MKDWYTTVTVSRPSGKDKWGDPLPSAEHEELDALFDPGSSVDDIDLDANPEEAAKLFFPDRYDVDIRNDDSVSFEWLGEPYSFTVNGRPLRYPLGVQVNLRA